MTAYIVRRMGLLLITWFGVTLIAFVLTHLVPADPILSMVGDSAPPEQVEAMRQKWGLDRPLPVQYVDYVTGLVQGDLGVSLRTRRPVLDDLRQYLPATIELAVSAMVLSIIIGLPLGIIAALYPNRWQDMISRIISIGGVSLPVFWLGLILLAIFYYRLGWLPGPGRIDAALVPPPTRTGFVFIDALLAGQTDVAWNAAKHLVLPAVALGSQSIATIARMTRATMLSVLPADFVRTARAKGISERAVITRHALRNALIPTITVIGVTFSSLLSGAVLTETIFAWPGVGRYATNSMVSVDIPAVVGVTLTIAIIYSLINLAVDVAYGFLDPRIRYSWAA